MLEIKESLKRGDKVDIKTDTLHIYFKRTQPDSVDDSSFQTTLTVNGDIYRVLNNVMEYMKNIDRLKYFYSLLAAIVDGYLDDNIALHLTLDKRHLYLLTSIKCMRYNETNLTFWATVQKVFKGKCVNFYRGHKGECVRETNDDAISPVDCFINFAVPSDSTLWNFTRKYNLEVHTGQMCQVGAGT